MPKGAKQSPFIGQSQSIEGILYPRYFDPSKAIVPDTSEEEASEKSAAKTKRKKRGTVEDETISTGRGDAEEPESEPTEPRKRKQKKRLTEAVGKIGEQPVELVSETASPQGAKDEAAASRQIAPASLEDEAQVSKKKKKKTKKDRVKEKRAKTAEKKEPSGPGNAEEAEQIRSVMGFTQKDTAAKNDSTPFNFGFRAAENGSSAIATERTDVSGAAAKTAADDDGSLHASANGFRPIEARQPQKASSQIRDGAVPRRVFIGGMPFGYDEDEVREYWSVCGEIEAMTLMRFPDTGRFKGIAFITFSDEAGYREALKCDGVMIDEQRVKVEPCTSAGSKGRPARARETNAGRKHSQPAPKTPGYHVAYVGNLAFEASPAELREVFSGCNVAFVRIHTDKDTGKPKGFAHVHFDDEASLDRAIQYDGFDLAGRNMKVGYAQPKKQ